MYVEVRAFPQAHGSSSLTCGVIQVVRSGIYMCVSLFDLSTLIRKTYGGLTYYPRSPTSLAPTGISLASHDSTRLAKRDIVVLKPLTAEMCSNKKLRRSSDSRGVNPLIFLVKPRLTNIPERYELRRK